MRTHSLPWPGLALSILLAGLIAGCRPLQPVPPIGSCTLGPASGTSDDEHIRAVLRAEGQFVVSQQIDKLMALWADGSSVVDAKNTPAIQADDQIWIDKDAVRHRYVRTVFPGAPAEAAPANLEVVIDGDQAVVTATTQIGAEVSPAGDRWSLQKQSGCWVIERLVYNLEASP